MHLRALIPSLFISIFAGGSKRDQRRRAELRETWGQEISRQRNMEVIARYHDSVETEGRKIDDRTWHDLGMDDLFAKIDRTTSLPGRQMLYHQLRMYENDDRVLMERARQQTIFNDDPELRESCQILLGRLNTARSEWLAASLLQPFPDAPSFAPRLYLSSFLTVACLVGLPFFHWLVLPLLLFAMTNFVITATYGQRITPYFSGFSQIVTMLGVAEKLASLKDGHALPQLEAVRKIIPTLGRLKKRLGWLVVDRNSLPELVASLFTYLNLLFLIDIVVYLRSISALREHRAALLHLFESIGSLDASMAAASYVHSLAVFSRPQLVDDRRLDVIGLYHPLLTAPVSNSLTLVDRSALIAGPNMAGKTAFIRTVGINVLLAQSLHLCFGERAVLPRLMVHSAIRREDDLNSGQSYFFAEIQQILEFIGMAGSGDRHLFLVDEIFRGTNTVERVAASTAVLHHLGREQLVLATTHDVELQELLSDTFDLYHFSDQVADGRYSFDYRIHPGPAESRNAIRLLELSGYPTAVIREAESLATRKSVKDRRAN